MQSAWNWAGIFAWLILLAYIAWMISNVHTRKRKLLKLSINSKKHYLVPKVSLRNFNITSIEIIILLVFTFGIGYQRRHHPINVNNSVVTSEVKPLQIAHNKPSKLHPMAKLHYYYLEINRTKSRNFTQTYHFMINGQNDKASNKNALLAKNPKELRNDKKLPFLVQKELKNHISAKKANSNKPWVMKITTRYKDSFANGIGLHSGAKKYSYTVIYVPKQIRNKGVYINDQRVQKKHKVNLK